MTVVDATLAEYCVSIIMVLYDLIITMILIQYATSVASTTAVT